MADHRRHHAAVQIEAMLDKAPPLFSNECCIYRVPHKLRKLNQDAYTLKIVSIGPFHYGNKQLLNMEGLKQMYCQRFIQRSDADLDDLVEQVQEMEPKVRRCYSERIDELTAEEFVKVILVDCCFIIELLWRGATEIDQSMQWLTIDIMWDLILLENQLPFFVLEKLYSLVFASCLNRDQQFPSFMQLASSWFPLEIEREELPPIASIRHFTDLYRYYLLQPLSYKLSGRGEEMLAHLYSATKLNEAGVNEGKCFLDLQLSGHDCLKIPQFIVMDTTELVLRNMVAFEQCHYPTKSYIIDYVMLFDFLIKTDEDVDVLVENGIIRNWIGNNNEVVKLFNGLCKNLELVGGNTDYIDICKRLNAYCQHPWH